MKKVVLISSYCDTSEKLEVLKNNINLLHNNNFDIVIFSPFCLDKEIIEKVNYIILSKENPYTSYPDKSVGFWIITEFDGEKYMLFNTVNDYGWSSLIQYKNMLDLVINRDYENFILMIYDTIIDEHLIEKLKNTTDTLMFPTLKKDGVIFPVGSQLMNFDRETIKFFYSHIFKKNYYKNNDVLETWLEKMTSYMSWNINDKPVVDGIQITNGIEQEVIKNETFKFFISNVTNNMAFYSVKEKLKVILNTESQEYEFEVENNKTLNIPTYNEFLKITINSHTYDVTEKIKKLNYSTIKKI